MSKVKADGPQYWVYLNFNYRMLTGTYADSFFSKWPLIKFNADEQTYMNFGTKYALAIFITAKATDLL